MALLWFDGFECYEDHNDVIVVSNPNLYSLDCAGPTMYNANAARHGGRGMTMDSYGDYYTMTFAENHVSAVFGIAFLKFASGTLTYVEARTLFAVLDGSTEQIQFHLSQSSPTELEARQGDGTLLGTTSGAGLVPSAWRYIEIKFLIDNSGGYIIVRVNENVVLNLTGIDTQMTANAYFNKIKIGAINDIDCFMDDLYVCDLTGSKNNDFLGDIRVDPLRPSGAGSHTDFTPSAGTNYENVDDPTYPDDDSTYNQSSAVGQKDSYAMEDLEALGKTIHGVKTQITVKKSDAGSKNIKVLTRSGGNDYLGESFVLSDSYLTHTKIYEDNPDDASAWEEADVNAMEAGLYVVTSTTSTTSTTTTTA